MERRSSFAWIIALIVLGCLSAQCGEIDQLKGAKVFTIPWGSKWGQLTFIPADKLTEGRFDGPSAMVASPTGDVYVYDPRVNRVQLFSANGRFVTGVQMATGTPEITSMSLGPMTRDKTQPLLMVSRYGFAGRVSSLPAKPGAAKVSSLPAAAVPDGVTIYNVAGSTGADVFTEEAGRGDVLTYIRQYENSSYVRHYELVDMAPVYPWYYALALNRDVNRLCGDAVGPVIRRFDVEGNVANGPALSLPVLDNAQSRWHMIGAGDSGDWPMFFFARSFPVSAGDDVYVVGGTGKIVGTAGVNIPGGKERTTYLKRLNHLTSVTQNGDLYMAIPDDAGLVIVRYAISGT